MLPICRPARHALGVLSLMALALPAAHAGDSPWLLRVGPAHVGFDAKSTVEVAGAPVPGGSIEVEDSTILAFELGYRATDRWTVRLAFGVPPTSTLSTGGTLNTLVPPLTGTLGKVKYGPAVLSATWALGDFGAFRPYVGAGINYTHVFKTTDGDIGGLRIKSAWGSALQAGFDVAIDRDWSLFVDARKVFVKTTATGTVPALGGPPAKANVTLDPLIVHIGAAYRF